MTTASNPTATPAQDAQGAQGQVRAPRILAIYAALDWLEQHPQGYRSQQPEERGGTPGYFTADEIYDTIQELRPTWQREGHPAAGYTGSPTSLKLGLTDLRETRRILFVGHYYGERRAYRYRAPDDAAVRAQQPPYTWEVGARPAQTFEYDPDKAARRRELARGKRPRRTLEIGDPTWERARVLARLAGAESTSDYTERALAAYNEQMARELGTSAARALAEADGTAGDPLLEALVPPTPAGIS